MGHHVQRMVERSDSADHALQRFSLGEDFAFLPMGCQVTGEDLTVIKDAELASETEDIEGTSHFIQRVLF